MNINYLAILVSGVASMVVGFIWYGLFFKKAYMKVICGDTVMSPEAIKEAQKRMGGVYFLQFILSIWTAYVLAWVVTNGGIGSSVTIAFWIWFGFVMPTIAGGAMWSGKARKLAWNMFFIVASAQLVTFVVMGAIIGAWK